MGLVTFLQARLSEDDSPREVVAFRRAVVHAELARALADGEPERLLPGVDSERLRRLAAVYSGHPDYRDEWH